MFMHPIKGTRRSFSLGENNNNNSSNGNELPLLGGVHLPPLSPSPFGANFSPLLPPVVEPDWPETADDDPFGSLPSESPIIVVGAAARPRFASQMGKLGTRFNERFIG